MVLTRFYVCNAILHIACSFILARCSLGIKDILVFANERDWLLFVVYSALIE